MLGKQRASAVLVVELRVRQELQRVGKEGQTVRGKLQTVMWKMRVTMRVVKPMQNTCMSWLYLWQGCTGEMDPTCG